MQSNMYFEPLVGKTLEKEEVNHFNILALENPRDVGELVGLQPMRSQGSNTT